jgi:hypothetical protein
LAEQRGQIVGAEGIFLIRDGELVLLEQRPYDSEALLQEALASFPAVLAGSSTVEESAASRLLLVRQEMGVPKAEGAGATWSLDHLFIDAEGVPVVVEVKRSSDTRIRREVLGQMLDYAANAVRYWPLAELRATFEATALDDGTTGAERLREAVPNLDPEVFWQRVEENLKAGRIRMMFVADHLPLELVRVIEFLNEQMSPAEVLGVEVPQYVGGGHQVLVPRVVGRTSSAVAAKQPSGTQWDEDGFLAVVAERHGDAQAAFFRQLFDQVSAHGGRLSWGRGASAGVSAWYPLGGESTVVWTASAGGTTDTARAYLYVYLPEVRRRVAVDTFADFVAGLAAIPAYQAKIEDAQAHDFAGKYPSLFVTDLLSHPEQVDQLLAVLDGLVRNSQSLLSDTAPTSAQS